MRLPIVAAARGDPQSVQPRADLPAQPAVRRRVLIVDDNADSAHSLALLVRAWGHEADVAQDAQEALARAKTLEPDVALVDIGMPGMDGHELARRLRAQPRYRDLVLVAVTGYGRTEDRDAAHRAGFDAYLVKPADSTELANLIAGVRAGRMQGND